MKKILFFVMALLLAFNLFAEKGNKIIEVGVTTTRPLYNAYNFTLKYGTETSLMRINSLSVDEYLNKRLYFDTNGSDTITSSMLSNDFEFAIAIGREKRKEISENFELRYGIDLTFGYSNDTDHGDETYNYHEIQTSKNFLVQPGMKLVLGLNYVLKDRIVFGVEFLPSCSYSFIKTVNMTERDGQVIRNRINTYNRFNLDIISTALFSISYRF